MKKQSLLIAVCLVAAMCFVACGAQNESDESEGVHKVSEEEKQSSGSGTIKLPDQSEESDTEDGQSEENVVAGTDEYTWQGVTVVLPDSWKGRCKIVEISDGFDIYQEASCDPESGTGFLCEITKIKEWLNYGTGETMLAYTDEGELYYFMQPTDFPCDVSDQSVVDEYQTMMKDIDQVRESVTFDVAGIHTDAGEYVIPVSSFLELREDQLWDASRNWLWLARNEVYARHGKIFTNSYLDSYFSSKSWYEPVSETVDDASLSQLERANVKLIQNQEKAYDETHPYPKRYENGTYATVDLNGDGHAEKVTYSLTQVGDWDYTTQIIIDGTVYDVSVDYYPEYPLDVFYITDISTDDERLELAILDNGPSDDPQTYFFQYDGQKINYVGSVTGFPFNEENGGRYGFDGANLVMGTMRADLIETSYLDGYWWYDVTSHTLTAQEGGLHSYQSFEPHELYVDLPVYICMDEDAPVRMLARQKEVYFLQSDLKEWILVQGADGTRGYVHVAEQKITNIDMPEEDVFSTVGYFD